ncbi:MAG: T9SS type A sorting domain-containing protein [Chitinophagales bacterium]|nr:T9SS type A sorting domain-containing protein [Chitinophagales bacterium]
MKKIILILACVIASAGMVTGQTTAMDFNRMDCNGNMRELFKDLDSGKVVILEYFMGPNCTACEDAAKEIEALKSKFLAKYPGKVMTYAMGFQNSYSCITIKSWVSNLGISAIPMDSAATQVAYYGGFAMPTIAVVAGTGHKILYSANANNGGYMNGDTSKISTEMNKFFNPTGIKGVASLLSAVKVFPNPSSYMVNIEFDVKQRTDITLQLVDAAGKIVWKEVNANVASGTFRKVLLTTEFVPGVYSFNIIENNNTTTNKINIAGK